MLYLVIKSILRITPCNTHCGLHTTSTKKIAFEQLKYTQPMFLSSSKFIRSILSQYSGQISDAPQSISLLSHNWISLVHVCTYIDIYLEPFVRLSKCCTHQRMWCQGSLVTIISTVCQQYSDLFRKSPLAGSYKHVEPSQQSPELIVDIMFNVSGPSSSRMRKATSQQGLLVLNPVSNQLQLFLCSAIEI